MSYAYTVELPIRYDDLDTMGHVTTAVYVTYLNQARLDYFEALLDTPVEERDMVVATLSLEFQHPISLDVKFVRVDLGVIKLGETSFTIGYEIYGGEMAEPAATGESVQVVYDRDKGRPQKVPEDWCERFLDHEEQL